MLIQAELEASFQKRLKAYTIELPTIHEGHAPALHRARVASRRLREVIPVMGLDRHTAHKLGRRLKKLTSQFGIVRELDVLVSLIDDLGRDPQHASAALKRIRDAVIETRRSARERLLRKLPLRKMQRLADKLALSVDRSNKRGHLGSPTGSVQPSWGGLRLRVRSRAVGLKSAIEAAGALYISERLHAVRIATKKLRYSAELLAETRQNRTALDIARLKSVQGLLGRLHDLEVLIAWARQVQASMSPPKLNVWGDINSLVGDLETECRRLHARYMRDRTWLAAIADRMSASGASADNVRQRAVG